MNKDEYKISLSNCDFNKKKIRLTSPYSLMACDLIGIDEEELLYIPKEEYLLKNYDCQNLSKELQDERYNHFNSKRLNLIKEAKAKRAELIKLNLNLHKKTLELDCQTNNSNIGNTTLYNRNDYLKKSSSAAQMGNTISSTGWGTSTAIKLGKEKLKKMKERQELSIRFQIDYECAMEENRRKNIERMKLKEEKEEKKREEKNLILMKKKRKEEQRERMRKRKEDEYNHKKEMERINNEKMKIMKLEEEEKKKEEEEKERKKQIEEQQRKEKQFRERIYQINKMHHFKLVEKQKELDEKDEKRMKNIEKMKDEVYRKMTEKRRLMQNKIKNALIRNEYLQNEKINLYLERQKRLEEIQELKEKEKEKELMKQTIENMRRTQKRKSILEKNENLMKQKIYKYNQKMELLKERQELRHQQEILNIEEEIKKREYKNRKLLQSRTNHERQLEENKFKLLTKIENNEERIKKQKYEQEQEKQKKYNKIYMIK